MSRYRVQYSPAAYDDLRAIYRYIAFELMVEETARAQTERIRYAIRALDTFPQRYRAVAWEPWASRGIRQMPVDHYCIFYRIDETGGIVTIIRIFYAGRDIKNIMSYAISPVRSPRRRGRRRTRCRGCRGSS